MSEAKAVRCDRCGARALCENNVDPPTTWGTVQLTRGKPFCNTGILDLCPECTEIVYTAIRRPDAAVT